MNLLDDEVRALLQQKADEVPPHGSMPQGLRRRVGTRIALNVTAAGGAVVVIVVGAVFGTRALTRPASSGFTSHGHSIVQTGNPPTTGVAPCTSGQLRAVGSLQGAAGSREGSFTITNFSDKTCTLSGTPDIRLLDPSMQEITSGITYLSSPPEWQVQGQAKPHGWPVVTLDPFKAASIRVRWGNWCPQGRTAPSWQIVIAGSDPIFVMAGTEDAPPCNGPTMPSTVERGPFEPAAAA